MKSEDPDADLVFDAVMLLIGLAMMFTSIGMLLSWWVVNAIIGGAIFYGAYTSIKGKKK